jgi:hypothetical protein
MPSISDQEKQQETEKLIQTAIKEVIQYRPTYLILVL